MRSLQNRSLTQSCVLALSNPFSVHDNSRLSRYGQSLFHSCNHNGDEHSALILFRVLPIVRGQFLSCLQLPQTESSAISRYLFEHTTHPKGVQYRRNRSRDTLTSPGRSEARGTLFAFQYTQLFRTFLFELRCLFGISTGLRA